MPPFLLTYYFQIIALSLLVKPYVTTEYKMGFLAQTTFSFLMHRGLSCCNFNEVPAPAFMYCGHTSIIAPHGGAGKALILASEPAEGAQNIFRPRFIIDSLKKKKKKELVRVIKITWILSDIFNQAAEKHGVKYGVKAQ